MSTSSTLYKIQRHLTRITLAPIEVFVFHSVSDTFDSSLCQKQDWTPTPAFQQHILKLKQKYTFISLPEAYRKLTTGILRRHRYAVLTSDDGNRSLLSLLPWLDRQQIPITLFLNPRYLDGTSIRPDYAPAPQYITQADLPSIHSPLVSIALHGYEHTDSTTLPPQEFDHQVDLCLQALQSHPRFIPYFAYTWGRYNSRTQDIIRHKGLIPVFCDGASNRRYRDGISRRCIDNPEGTATQQFL